MKHLHHIIPRHMGGSDDQSNLIELSVEEHADAHLKLYEQYGKYQDFVAYKCLMGYLSKVEIIQERCRIGGLVQGGKNRDNGHMKNIQKLSDKVENGRKGGNKVIELKKGSFGDPEQRVKAASKGGSVQGKNNSESGHLKNISAEYWNNVKTGKLIRIKKKWIHNIDQKISILIPETQEIPDGFLLGRKIKW